MENKIPLIFGIGILVLIPIYIFLIVPEIEKMDSRDISWRLTHFEENRFELNGEWTSQYETASYWNEKLKDGILDTQFVVGEPGNIVYEIKNKFIIDPNTGHNLAGESDNNAGAYAVFPLHVKKQAYTYWPAGYGQSFDLEFKRTQKLFGVDVYHFKIADGLSDDTKGYEFLELVPEKYNAFSKFEIDVYVEPVSGIIVNYNDKGRSYYADEKGNKVQDISEWRNEFN